MVSILYFIVYTVKVRTLLKRINKINFLELLIEKQMRLCNAFIKRETVELPVCEFKRQVGFGCAYIMHTSIQILFIFKVNRTAVL